MGVGLGPTYRQSFRVGRRQGGAAAPRLPPLRELPAVSFGKSGVTWSSSVSGNKTALGQGERHVKQGCRIATKIRFSSFLSWLRFFQEIHGRRGGSSDWKTLWEIQHRLMLGTEFTIPQLRRASRLLVIGQQRDFLGRGGKMLCLSRDCS